MDWKLPSPIFLSDPENDPALTVEVKGSESKTSKGSRARQVWDCEAPLTNDPFDLLLTKAANLLQNFILEIESLVIEVRQPVPHDRDATNSTKYSYEESELLFSGEVAYIVLWNLSSSTR